jgi:hypothetical protein
LNTCLTECVWAEQPSLYNSTGDALPEVALNQIRSVLETSFLSPFGQSLTVRHQVRTYREILAAGISFASDPKLGVVFVHFPIPHPPYIFDPRTGRLDLRNSPVAGYTGGLALADRSLGQLRRAMEATGVWDRTAVLISADHGYRGVISVDAGKIADRWVPFLLKLPGIHQPYEYGDRLETVRSADLLLDILNGRIFTPGEIAAWLERPALPSAGRMAAREGVPDWNSLK